MQFTFWLMAKGAAAGGSV